MSNDENHNSHSNNSLCYFCACMCIPLLTMYNGYFPQNLKCFVEGSKPLKLTLTGTCVDIPPSRDAVHFTTYVRHKETKNVLVQNRTNVSCTIRPIIDGEYWSGADTFSMEPSSSKPYEVSYKPLTMTLDNKKHQVCMHLWIFYLSDCEV